MCARELCSQLNRRGDPVGVAAAALLHVAPFFKLYTAHCSNYAEATATLSRCRKRAPFASFPAQQSALRPCKGLDIDAYLIKPVQRLTKWESRPATHQEQVAPCRPRDD